MSRFCLVSVIAHVIALSFALCVDAQDVIAEPATVAQGIEEALKSDKDRKQWEGIYTEQRALRGRTVYIANEQWAELSTSRQASGTVSFRERLLELSASNKSDEIHRRYFVIRWSERVYLVEESRIFQFINAVNSGDEPCGESPGAFLVSVDARSDKVEGHPLLPKGFQAYVLEKPNRGRINRILGRCKRVDVKNYGWIAAGTEVEIAPDDWTVSFVGMTLEVDNSTKFYRAIVIDNSDKSKGAVRAIVPDVLLLKGNGPEKGDRLSTRVELKRK